MNFVGKKGKAFDCFMDFKKDYNAKEYQQLIDIFLPMLFQENNHHLEINVGKRVSDSQFMYWLSLVTNKFVIIPSVYGNELQITIKDNTNRVAKAVTTINLMAVNDLYIETEEAAGFYSHKICFNYKNEVDYQMRIVVNKE